MWFSILHPIMSAKPQLACHSRMLLAGIQAEFGLDPRSKHSGVTDWVVAIPFLSHTAIFAEAREGREEAYVKVGSGGGHITIITGGRLWLRDGFARGLRKVRA